MLLVSYDGAASQYLWLEGKLELGTLDSTGDTAVDESFANPAVLGDFYPIFGGKNKNKIFQGIIIVVCACQH